MWLRCSTICYAEFVVEVLPSIPNVAAESCFEFVHRHQQLSTSAENGYYYSTPLQKKGDVLNPKNKRPISSVHCLSKLFERIIYEHLYVCIRTQKILHECQFGFRWRRN